MLLLAPGFLPFHYLALSLLLFIFLQKKLYGVVSLVGALGLALVYGQLTFLGASVSVAFLALFWLLTRIKNKYFQVGLYLLIIASSLALALHVVPGFNNLQILDQIKITPDATSYSLWLNFDKTLVAIGFLWFLNLKSKENYLSSLKKFFVVAPIGIFLVIALAFIMGYVDFAPKWSEFTGIWAFKVLLFTCFAEECFFRGVLWQALAKRKLNEKLILGLTSLLFGLAHFAGGVQYVILASVAGLFYGLIYLRTGRIGFAIALHFILNLVHFLFFTYPALQ